MVAIGLSAGGVARIRFAVSCLWEVVASLRVLRDPGDHAVHLPWVRRVRPRLTEARLVGPDAGLLWQLVPAPPGYLADFLTPPPAGLHADLDTELAALRDTPAGTVRAHLDLYPGARTPALAALHADPVTGLRRLAEEIWAYWRIALAPDWPRLRLLLDADVSARARRLAEDGAGALLNDLHQQVRWEDDTLLIAQRHCLAPDVPERPGLVLVPSVFVWPSVLSVSAGDPPQLAYPARGLATLWERPPGVPDALAAVVGRGRARLLAELAVPASTSELARRTGMSPGGVSQHLTALRAAGLVVTHRRGRMLLSARTDLADALLSAAA
ncbi:helix-turn-helix domain-containing protein [Micromonospora krabiensis]|uniref:Helix-turn-helix domain-containing protein n=1 Tax=Micromonospora krabiensis TaxID=307121 RepID=A0A1C3N3C7_9ACTN|nr:helix-turn-helix domain-containing protein [Micromonospora krabiensis]SBV27077.1 Helix-turn-helix domain-containing protein [Micromonospora krabiensis]